MPTKVWLLIVFVSLLAGAGITYKFFPQTIKTEKLVYKDKLAITDGKLSVYDGAFKLMPDGTWDVKGKFDFVFGSYSSVSSGSSETTQKLVNRSYLGPLVNPFNPLMDNGIMFDTPFLFSTRAWISVEQQDFKVFKGKVGIGFPL